MVLRDEDGHARSGDAPHRALPPRQPYLPGRGHIEESGLSGINRDLAAEALNSLGSRVLMSRDTETQHKREKGSRTCQAEAVSSEATNVYFRIWQQDDSTLASY